MEEEQKISWRLAALTWISMGITIGLTLGVHTLYLYLQHKEFKTQDTLLFFSTLDSILVFLLMVCFGIGSISILGPWFYPNKKKNLLKYGLTSFVVVLILTGTIMYKYFDSYYNVTDEGVFFHNDTPFGTRSYSWEQVEYVQGRLFYSNRCRWAYQLNFKDGQFINIADGKDPEEIEALKVVDAQLRAINIQFYIDPIKAEDVNKIERDPKWRSSVEDIKTVFHAGK